MKIKVEMFDVDEKAMTIVLKALKKIEKNQIYYSGNNLFDIKIED